MSAPDKAAMPYELYSDTPKRGEEGDNAKKGEESDAGAMAAAFGHSALFCAAHTEVPSETDQMVLERLKSLNVTDILRHFRGDGELPSPPIAPSADTPQFPVAGFKGALHWPAL